MVNNCDYRGEKRSETQRPLLCEIGQPCATNHNAIKLVSSGAHLGEVNSKIDHYAEIRDGRGKDIRKILHGIFAFQNRNESDWGYAEGTD